VADQHYGELDGLIAQYKHQEVATDTAEPGLELDPAAPLPSAKLFIEWHYTTAGLRTLQHHAGAFYAWNGRCYEPADPQSIRGKLYSFLDAAQRRDPKGNLVPFKPNMARVSNVSDAIQAVANLPSSVRAPAWLPNVANTPLASEIVTCGNGLLHLPTGTLSDLTPTFFSLNALNFAFDPEAPPPTEWLRFLDSLWTTTWKR
jgi:putative DNA primase/helicase